MRLGVAARGLFLVALIHLPLALHIHFPHIHFPFHIHFHFRHRFHGPPFDYVGLAVGSAVSAAGFPGPGETLLIAAGILAAKSKLDLASVIFIAFVGSTVGGIIGWWVGMKVGRTIMEAPGPLRRARLRALRRGERIFLRFPGAAVLLTPAWVAGVHKVRSRVYQPWNALGAAIWAVGVGVGAYFVGPPIVDAVDDVGTASLAIVGAVVVALLLLALIRHRRNIKRAAAADG